MQMGDTQSMTRITLVLSLLLGSCAMPPLAPELTACLARMEGHAADLMPAFDALGYRPDVHLRLDDDLADVRGFRKPASTMGDALPGGSIRLRPSHVCADDMLGRAVVAHEMAHVVLQHRGVAGSGVTLLWETRPRQEVEADELAYAALTRAGGDARAAVLVSCWLGKCDGIAPSGRMPRRW